MTDPKFAPGEEVVDLAFLLRQAAVLAGAVSCVAALWILKHNVVWLIVSFVLGGAGGFILGSLLGSVIFPAPNGQVVVVKVGAESLPLTLKATLVGGVSAGLVAALLPPILLLQFSKLAELSGAGLVIGIVLGGVPGYFASRSKIATSDHDAARFNQLFEHAGSRVQNDLCTDGRPDTRLGYFTSRRLAKSEKELREALEIHPKSWAAMWFLGKIFQRRRDHKEALSWFCKAFEINSSDSNVCREVGLEALETGAYSDSIRFFQAALNSEPAHGGHNANLALAYLLSGHIQSALREAHEAVNKDTSDAISNRLLSIIKEVEAGKRGRPRSMADLR